MNNALITILSLSVSGSLLALVLFAGKPFFKNKVSKAFCYYIWLLVLLRLTLPVSSPVGLMDFVPDPAEGSLSRVISVTDGSGYHTLERTLSQSQTEPEGTVPAPEPSANNGAIRPPAEAEDTFSLHNGIKGKLLWIWLAGAVLSFGWFTVAYIVFARRIGHSLVTPHHEDIAVFRRIHGRRRIRLACSSRVATPMLIGILRPVIVLPQLAYVHSGKGGELVNILRHELTHYRRKDLLYKWLVVAVTSLHWFNPLMLPIRREINRACELSCDEAVISGMSAEEKQFYGNTLLALSAHRKLPSGILATTLCENKKDLKERLISIMKYKRRSVWTVTLTLFLALLLAGCTVVLGSTGRAVTDENAAQNKIYYSDDIDFSNSIEAGVASSLKADLDGDGAKETAELIVTARDSVRLDSRKWTLVYRDGKTEASIPVFEGYEGGFETSIAAGHIVGSDSVDFLVSSNMRGMPFGGYYYELYSLRDGTLKKVDVSKITDGTPFDISVDESNQTARLTANGSEKTVRLSDLERSDYQYYGEEFCQVFFIEMKLQSVPGAYLPELVTTEVIAAVLPNNLTYLHTTYRYIGGEWEIQSVEFYDLE